MSYSNYTLNQKINNLQNQINGGGTVLATNNTWTGTNTFDNNVRLNSTLTDTSGDIGTAGQVLSSTGSGTNWITQSTGSTYIAYTASATLPTTTNPTLIVLYSGSTASQTLTIPTLAYSTGQVIQFKNRASVNVTISSGLSSMFLYASGITNTTIVSSYSLAPNDTYNLYWIGFVYIQYTPSNTFSTLASPIYNSAIDTTAGSTALTIGSNVITGNIVIGTNTAFNGIINIGGSSVSPNLPNILVGAYNTTLQLVKGFVLSVDTSLGLGQYKSYLNVDDIRTSLYLGNNITSGSLRLGSSLTTGDIYLGESQTAGGIVSIGSINTNTTINGVLIGQNGCLAGRTNYETFAVSTTIPTNINLNYLGVFTGPSTGQTITIPSTGYNVGQIITIKNSANIDVFVTTGTVPTVLYSVTLTATTYTLKKRDTMNLIYTGVSWIQYTPSNKFTDLELTGSLTSSTSVLSPVINPVSDALATVTALSIGSNVVNGNIVIGSALGVGDVSIASAQATGGTVTIGSSNSDTTINGTTKLTGPLNVNSSTGILDQYLASTGLTQPIWKTLPASTWVGTATSDLGMGIYSINTPTINPLAATSNLGICSLQSSGVLNLGVGNRTKTTGTAEGNINIGTGNNTLISGSVGPTINIGNNTAGTNVTEISIGASATKTTINGPLTLTGASTVQSISGSGLFTTSSNITTTGTGGFSSVAGDITATAGKVKTATLDAVADTLTNTIALTIGSNIVNGNIVIGSALGTGDIAIAGSHLTGGTVTIGTTATQTTINGLVKVTSPAIANPLSANTTQAATNTTLYGNLMFANVGVAYTIPSNINREFFLVITGTTKTITMPALNIHQIINIKILSANSQNITAPVVGTQFYSNTGGNVATTFIMLGDTTQRFYCDGAGWYGY